MDKKISWVICDDAEHARSVYRRGLEKYEDLTLLGECADCESCVELCRKVTPDILLLDVQLEFDKLGIDAIPDVKDASPVTKIVMLSGYNDDDYIFLAFAKGADNYVLKEDSLKLLHDTMVNVYNSQNVISGDVAHTLVKKSRETEVRQRSLLQMLEIMSRLSVSEYEVLKLIYAGKSYREIAKERFVEVATIKVQASRILKKFNEKSMVVLIAQIKNLKLFDLFKDVRG